MKTGIGIDVGGTSLRIAKVNELGKIVSLKKVETEAEKGPEQITQKLIEAVNEIKDETTVGVGIGVPGQVSNETGVVLDCVNISMKNYPLGTQIKEATGLNVSLNNDANVAALAEAKYGKAKGKSIVYYVTWSTGIGGGLVIDGKVINGKNYYTGEIGNIIVDSANEYKHSIQNKGALEGLASGNALARYAKELGYPSVKELIQAYEAKEENAVKLIETVTDYLARALSAIVHTIEVEAFVFGGGVTLNSGDYLIPLVHKKFENYVMPVLNEKVEFYMTDLGDNNGIIGSAGMVL